MDPSLLETIWTKLTVALTKLELLWEWLLRTTCGPKDLIMFQLPPYHVLAGGFQGMLYSGVDSSMAAMETLSFWTPLNAIFLVSRVSPGSKIFFTWLCAEYNRKINALETLHFNQLHLLSLYFVYWNSFSLRCRRLFFSYFFAFKGYSRAKAKPRSTTPTKTTNCIEIQQLQIEAGEVSSVRWTKRGLSNNKDTTNTVNRIN